LEAGIDLPYQPVFPVKNGKLAVKTDLVANNPKLLKIQNEISHILFLDEAQSDEDSLRFPSLNVKIKAPQAKGEIN